MPRKARIDAPGALHHVIVRGIERRKIFRSDSDRKNFLGRLSELSPETKTDCFAWALISNHAHLLLRTGLVPIASFMSRLLTGYAGWFNKKYRRHGQLFQNRYKSILCQEDLYLKELVRYIHLNPLRAGIVSSLDELAKYSWCGHNALVKPPKDTWQNIDYIYSFFSKNKKEACKMYKDFVGKGVSLGKRPELTGGGLLRSSGGWSALKEFRKAGIRLKGDERILGNSDFVENVLNSSEESFEEKYKLKAMGIDFNYLKDRVAEIMEITSEEVTACDKSPQTVQARSLLCFWANRKLGMNTIEIARILNMSQSAISRSSRRGEVIARKNQFMVIDN